MNELIEAVQATVLKLEPGDILFCRLPEDILDDSDAVAQMSESIKFALDVTGNMDKVAVLITTDAITLEVVRPDTGE